MKVFQGKDRLEKVSSKDAEIVAPEATLELNSIYKLKDNTTPVRAEIYTHDEKAVKFFKLCEKTFEI